MAYRGEEDRDRRGRNSFRTGGDLEEEYGRRADLRGRYREEYLEDEEDYEEFARERDLEYARRARGENAGERSRRPADSVKRKATGTRSGPEDGRRSSRRTGGPERDFARNRRAAAKTGHVEEERDPGRPVKKKRGILGIILRLLIIAFLLAVIIGGLLAFRMRDVLEMQRVNSVDLEEELRPGISPQVTNDELMSGYTNIALFGVDSRTGDLLDGDNRSDSIMIASINKETGEIKLVSVFRDTMLNVGNDYYTKANTAYALGGPAQAINMLNRCFDLNILDFVTVGFEGLAHTIDALGGIEIEIDEEERGYLNMYLHDMHVELGTDETPVEETGLVRLTGIQATAYSRIRYTAGDDFKRAERQRTVLQKTLEKAKEASPTALVDVANNVVGDMATSLSSKEIVGLILKAGSLQLADTGGLPQEEYRAFGENVEDGSFILPLTLEDNIRWLHLFLFNEEDYQISDEASAVNTYLQNNYWPAY